MTTATRTPELTPEGWVIVTAEYRNDDPAELGLMDDCWHRGAYWRYTVAGTDMVEEGDCYGRPGNDSLAAYDRLMTRLAKMGHESNYAKVTYTGKCLNPGRSDLKLIEAR